MDNKEENLYHYTNSDSLFKILETQTLKLGTFDSVNDPKESKNWCFKFICLKSESKTNFSSKLFDQINNFILKKTKILCLSTNNDIDNIEDVDTLKKGYTYPRMWSHYAENHKGACLVFDEKLLKKEFDLFFNNKIRFKGKVEYLNSTYEPRKINSTLGPHDIIYDFFLNEGLKNYMIHHIKKHYEHLYLYKHFNWRDENEYRFIVLDNENDNQYFLPFKKSLKSIIITEDFPKEKLSSLNTLANNLNLKIERLFWRGWAIHKLPFSNEKLGQESISMDGISCPIDFYYELLYTQACNQAGEMKTILFDFKDNGKVKLVNE